MTMETLIKDIRYGIRSLAKRSGFTAIAVITLAVGIGASTAIFSVVDGVLLRSLPYPHAEQIVQLREVSLSGAQMRFTEPNYLDVRARSRTLGAVAQYGGNLTTTILFVVGIGGLFYARAMGDERRSPGGAEI
jgi:putative ABC transport system permease protein